MILTLGTGASSTVSVNYTTPSLTYVVGSLTKRDYYTNLASISTTVTATSYAIGDGYDSLKVTFAAPPANNSVLQVELSQKYLYARRAFHCYCKRAGTTIRSTKNNFCRWQQQAGYTAACREKNY